MFAARSVEMLHKTATAHERASTDCIMHARARLTVSTISGKKICKRGRSFDASVTKW